MPALKNQRHELFCRNLIEGAQRGWSATDAYIKAGYKGEEGVARACASRLLTNANVKRRLEELNAPAVRKTQITAETLLNKLEANITGAEAKGQHGAVNGSIGLMAQLRGLLINRTEIGAPGSFDGCESVEQVIAALLSDQTPAQALEQLDGLRSEIERYAADHATLVPHAEPAKPRAPGTAADRALQYLRPKHRLPSARKS
jgi:Terminase small subunit